MNVLSSISGRDARERIRQRRVVSDRSLRYLHYVPAGAPRTDLVLVAVHGISRNAMEHAQAFQALADRLGCHLVAPQFDRSTFRDFQLLGLSQRGRRADHALQSMLADVRRFGVDADARLVLSGYSGGAQFAHRYAMAHPRRVAALLVAAAGWYTLPDESLPYPRGCGGGAGAGVVLDPLALLRKPVLVLVGDRDDERDAALRCDDWIDRDQGRNRIERARSWVERLASEARRRDFTPLSEFGLIRGAGHDFSAMVAAGLVTQFEQFLLSNTALLSGGD
jgi:pimeloyl-ACP methyl ester carboxylesterase